MEMEAGSFTIFLRQFDLTYDNEQIRDDWIRSKIGFQESP